MNGSPTGLIAVDKMGGKVLFIAPESWATLAVLDDLAPVPHELLIMPDRARAYIPIYGPGVHGRNPEPGHLLAIIDLRSRTHIGDIDLSPHLGPHGIQLGPDGLIALTCEATGVVVLVDPAQDRMIGAIETGSRNSHRCALLPDGSKLYTENEEDASISVLDLGRRALIRQISTPHPLAGIAAAPDGRLVVAVDGERPVLLLIDPARDVILREVILTGHRRGAQIARYSPDGRHLLVTSSAEGIVTLLDPTFTRQTTLPAGAGPMDACFHQKGQRCLVANQRDGTVTIIDLGDGNHTLPRVAGSFRAGKGCETLGFF